MLNEHHPLSYDRYCCPKCDHEASFPCPTHSGTVEVETETMLYAVESQHISGGFRSVCFIRPADLERTTKFLTEKGYNFEVAPLK